MGVSGQRHAPAALYPRGKDPWYPLYRRLGGPQSRYGDRGYRKNPLPLPGIEPRSPGRPVRSQLLYWLSSPGSVTYYGTKLNQQPVYRRVNSLPTSARDDSKSPWLLGHCSRHLRKSCADANIIYSRAERVFIVEYYFASKSFAAVREALNNVYRDKEGAG
jgi:hypothetical protein